MSSTKQLKSFDFDRQTIGYDTLSLSAERPWTQPPTTWGKVKLAVTEWAARLFCFGDEWEQSMEEAYVREQVRRSMMEHVAPSSRDPIDAVTYSVFRDTGYDLKDYRVKHDEHYSDVMELVCNASVSDAARDAADTVEAAMESLVLKIEEAADAWTTRCKEERLVEDYRDKPVHHKLSVIPKFVAAMVICLRAKNGNMPLNEANRLLVEREYLRMCREGNVRQCDIVHHSQWVYNAYFGEGVLDELPTTRARIPKWMRAVLGSAPKCSPAVC
jgi:hypothetical protein